MRDDYLRWHKYQVVTGDIDPVYPVLRHLADTWGLDAEARAWLCVMHVVWYHPGSTLAGFQRAPSVRDLPDDPWGSELLDLPCLTERRGHRPKPPLVQHLTGLSTSFPDGVWTWANEAIADAEDPQDAWLRLNDALTTLVGNGRWAAYKTAEMFQKVCDLPVVAADAGHRYSTGPRKGLALLSEVPSGDSPPEIAELDKLTAELADQLGEPDLAQVETSLCDFNSLVHGRYYLGHDIDSMLEAWNHPKVQDSIPDAAWSARQASFLPTFLGEYGGWNGVRRELKRRYRDSGEFV